MFALVGIVMLIVGSCLALDEAKTLPPIEPVQGILVDDDVLKNGKPTKPLVIRSKEDARKHLDKKSAAALAELIDFDKQVVLVFAWQGSGQDKLTYRIMESFPEQIAFHSTAGKTDDLRSHIHVFALRADVKWRVM